MHLEASCGTFLVSKSKNVFFPPENAILELILAFCGDFIQNTPPWTEKMCSEACKVKKHTQSIPNSKGLRQNITKMIIGNFLQKSKFYIFSKISILENVDFTSHFLQEMYEVLSFLQICWLLRASKSFETFPLSSKTSLTCLRTSN